MNTMSFDNNILGAGLKQDVNTGKRLKQLRENKGKKQSEIADELGISLNIYIRYEQGVKYPDLAELEKFAKYFSVTIHYLLGMEK